MCASKKVLQQDETDDEVPGKPIRWGLKTGKKLIDPEGEKGG